MNLTEQLIERDLNELLGGDTAPDLIAQTLARIEGGETATPELAGTEPAQSLSEQPAGRLVMLRRLATAACVILALGLITWVLWPQPLPETVTGSSSANYLVRDDHIQLNQGWLLLNDGAPLVRTDSGRVSVAGRAVVGLGIPGDDALDSLAMELGLSAEETAMFKMKERWVTAASLAMCLFSGQAMFNGEQVVAQDLPQPEIKEAKIELPDRDDLPALRKLIKQASAVRIRSTGGGAEPWGGTLEVDTPRVVLDAISDGLGERMTEGPDSKISNLIELQLPGDSVLTCTLQDRVTTLDGVVDMLRIFGPGWDSVEWYRIDAKATAVLSGWIVKAKGLPELATQAFRVLRKWEGADSEVVDKSCVVVSDKDAWSALWMAHTINPMDDPVNPPKLPEVDFEKELIVAVFGGQSVNSRGYFVQEILNARNGWVIRVDETTYQTANKADDVTPYGIWVLPKDSGSIAVEENVQGLKDAGPVWKPIGGMLGTDDVRDDTKDYLPTHTITRNGGPEVPATEVQVIRSLNVWQKALARIDDDSAKWPDPDFSNEMAVVALGSTTGRGNFVLDVWGFSPTALHLRLITPQGRDAVSKTVFGVWVMKRRAVDIVVETPNYGRIGEPARWQTTLTAKQKDEAFGIYDDIYGTSEEADSKYLLIDNQADLDKNVENVPANWVDWSSERVVLLRHERMRIFAGMSATVSELSGEHVLTYHLTAPSGVVAEPVTQYLALKIRKPEKTLVIKQSLQTGPSPADIKEVARFEK
ncbi:MAG: hypothetical protein K8I27_16385 [Planctomycetes bacterium]|nr:hypothetical protein [Planctomycetota bacterium]